MVGLPLTQARERPSAETSRRMTSRSSSASRPSSSSSGGEGVDRLEGALDQRPRGARPDRAAVAPGAKQQGDGVHQQRLAGAGLAGEDVEAGAELERHVVDGGEVADPELGDHFTVSRSSRSPQCSFWRMRLK